MSDASRLLAAITAVVAEPIQPRSRIIVGFPLVGENAWIDAPERGLSLCGTAAWAKLQGLLKSETPTEEKALAHLWLTGVPVERYDHKNAEHRALAFELTGSLVAAARHKRRSSTERAPGERQS